MLIDEVYALQCSQQTGRSREISLICVNPRSSFSTGFPNAKPHQLEAILVFCKGKDVFMSLPTGFGKKLNFVVLLSLFNTPALSLHSNSKLRFLLSGTFFLYTQQQACSIAPREGTHNTLARAFNDLHICGCVGGRILA